MIGVDAISGGILGLLLFAATALILLAGTVAGTAMIAARRKTGWLLASVSGTLLAALFFGLFMTLRIPNESITVRLGSTWRGAADACTNLDGGQICFPKAARYTTRVVLPDGSVKTLRGEQLFVLVDANGNVGASQLAMAPEPDDASLTEMLGREVQGATPLIGTV